MDETITSDLDRLRLLMSDGYSLRIQPPNPDVEEPGRFRVVDFSSPGTQTAAVALVCVDGFYQSSTELGELAQRIKAAIRNKPKCGGCG